LLNADDLDVVDPMEDVADLDLGRVGPNDALLDSPEKLGNVGNEGSGLSSEALDVTDFKDLGVVLRDCIGENFSFSVGTISSGVEGVISATVFSTGFVSFGIKLRLLDCLDKASPVSREGVLPTAAVRGLFLFFTKLRLPTLRDNELDRELLGEGSKLRLARPLESATPTSREGVLPTAAVKGLFMFGSRLRLPTPRSIELDRDSRPEGVS